MAVPKKMRPVCDAAMPIFKTFCDTFLEEEAEDYFDLCMKALEKLCRMRPSPLLAGRLRTWIAGIAYFICAQNDRFVISCPKRLPASDVAGFFGLSASTVSLQANKIRRLFGVLNFSERCADFLDLVDDPWRLPSTDAMMRLPKPEPPMLSPPQLPADFSDIYERFRTP